MHPSDLYSGLLAALTSTRSDLLSPAWQAALDQSSADTRIAAGKQLIALQGAILALSNASLNDIAEEMKANEADLTTCTNNLRGALKDLTKVQDVLSSVSSALKVVAKIVPLL